MQLGLKVKLWSLAAACCRVGGVKRHSRCCVADCRGGTGAGVFILPHRQIYTPGQDRLLINFGLVPDKFSWEAPLRVLCCTLWTVWRGELGLGEEGAFDRCWVRLRVDYNTGSHINLLHRKVPTWDVVLQTAEKEGRRQGSGLLIDLRGGGIISTVAVGSASPL